MALRVAFLLLLALAGCARGPSLEVRQCLDTLGKRGVSFVNASAPGPGSGCGINGAVAVRQSSVAYDQTATMSCALALAVNDFETRVVQPAARRHFGQPVTLIRHFGAYSCRNSTGGVRGRLSQHALGNAIDIHGFTLGNGTKIEVKGDWTPRGPKADFLHEIAREACRSFNVVLTPNSDKDHQDHIHLDIGPYKQCGA